MRAAGSALGLALAATIAVAALDQFVKAAVRARLAPGERVPIFGSWFRLSRVENPGVAFGLLRGRPRLAELAATLATAALAALALRSPSRPAALAAGLVLGGWAGNGLDRRRAGTVTDFLDLGVGQWRWPSFNLADAAIVSGATLLAEVLRQQGEGRTAS